MNGEPAPLLFASAGQINFILPFTLAHASKSPFSPASREISHRRSPPVHNFFERDFPCKLYRLSSCRTERRRDHRLRLESRAKASRVVLCGTGDGMTNPPSGAGEVTPLELRPSKIL